MADFQYLHCVLHPDSKLARADSSGLLSAVRHCWVPAFALQQGVLPSGSSCTALCARGSRKRWECLPVPISVCTPLIQGCSRAASERGTDKSHRRQNQVRQCPLNVSPAVHTCSGEEMWSQKSGEAVAACPSRTARYLSLIIHR